MTDHTNLITRLRDWRGDPDEVMQDAADALEALQADLTQERIDYTSKCAELEIVHGDCDQLRLELAVQASSIEAVQTANLRLAVKVAFLSKTGELFHAENVELHARLTALESQEPVAYEFRMRADWVADWGLWSPCNKEQHKMYIRAPKLHDWVYETRALFLAAGAAPKPALYRLMHKEGAAWIPASEWMTEADPSWVKLAQDKPAEWCIKEPLDGKKVAAAFRTAFAAGATPTKEQT